MFGRRPEDAGGTIWTSATCHALVAAAIALTGRPCAAVGQAGRDADVSAIEELIERTYVDAVFRRRDPDPMRDGFADTFVMQVYWDGELTTRTFDQWLDRMRLDREPSRRRVRGDVTVLDITGVAAVARLDLYEESAHRYTDYFGLYRTREGWKIVTKHFHAHGYDGHRPAAAPAKESAETGLAARIRAHVAPYVADGNFSGSVAVRRGEKVLAAAAFGRTSAGGGTANTPETRHHVASLSKPITACAVMLLVDDGRLSPDDPIAELLPGFPNGDRITLHHLLTHTSGIPDINRFPEYRELSTTPQTAASLTAAIARRSKEVTPGDYRYSNSNYNLLARVIEVASGRSYADFVTERIFRPLGMEATADSGSDADLGLPPPAEGQIPAGLWGVAPAPDLDWSIKTGNGSIVSTAGDLARFLHRLHHDPILTDASRDLMLRAHAGGNTGYGFFVGERFGRPVDYYNGNTPGVSSAFELYPQEDLQVVVLANHDVALAGEIARSIAAMVFGEPVETPERLPRYAPEGGVPGYDYVGRYPLGVGFDVSWEDGLLVARGAWPRYPCALVPIGPDRFLHRFYPGNELRFQRGADGEVSGLHWAGRTAERE